MFNTVKEATDWIQKQLQFGMKPGLERMELALNLLNNPHLELPIIHVAGTNGKGSTVTYLRSILQEANYQVGTFTSPYIEMFNDRICLNGIPISDEDLVFCANEVKAVVEEVNQSRFGNMTEFELVTLLSFVYFKHKAPDIVIYEVGLGGRLDSTNVVKPLVCAITNIGHDHQGVLGETLEEIAREKFGIIKPNTPVFTTIEQPSVLALLQEFKEVYHAPIYEPLTMYQPTQVSYTESGMHFDLQCFENITLGMHGQHQVKNATLAYGVIKYLKEKMDFDINEVCIYRGFKKAFWKGRFEVVSQQNPVIVIDGAHNEEGVEQLCQTLVNKYPDYNYHIVMSVLSDKDLVTLIKPIERIATQIYFTTFDFYRAQTPEQMKEKSKIEEALIYESIEVLLPDVLASLGPKDCLVITGSLYFISEVRNYLTT